MKVIILGGGIGGLATALSLHAAGIPCRVYESSPEIKPLGVGINVLPHSVRELTELGLLPELEKIGIRTQELVYATKRGEIVWREPRGQYAGYNWPQFSVHRGHLQMMLYEAVVARMGEEAVVTDHEAVDVTQDGNVATAHFVSRSTGAKLPAVSGDLIIAADGIHSKIRSKFYPDEGPPIWSRRILWRGTTIRKPFLTGASMVLAGYAWKKWVCYPIRQLDDGMQMINWIAELTFDSTSIHAPEDWNRLGKLEDFMPDFEKWNFDWMPVADIIRGAQSVYEYPMSDRNPVASWIFGRVALLGDAAHAMYPIGSNGASQAILDARRLAYELATKSSIEEALIAYDSDRRPATAKLLELTRAEGPDAVLQVVEEKAPDGFDDLENVVPMAEREAIAARYKAAAGFDRELLNSKPSLSVRWPGARS
jgi:2-polyprenyl-6-methoxyphenol hydroxylase-like FAD-dependent oxidoreductase